MPTIGIEPSMRNTQAYGAALLHGFALDRLEAANVENAREFVREAEKEEELDQLAAELLSQEDVDGLNSTNGTNNFSTIANNSFEDSNLLSSTLVPNNSTNTTNNSSLNNTTINSEQYKSMMPNDNTVYHSINAGDSQTRMSTSSNFDRIQRLPIMIDYGRKLRNIAEEFEKHRLRQEVKSQAEGFDFANMNQENFEHLLEELFKSGVTREKIAILFFFCTDLAIKAATSIPELVVRLLQWSFRYIIHKFCTFVYHLGGWTIALSSEKWDDILFRQLPSALVSCVTVLGILTMMTYLRKMLRA